MSQSDLISCQVGDFQITALSDGTMKASLELLSGIEIAEASAIQQRAGITEPGNIDIHGYLLRGRGRTLLIDAGTGGRNHAGGQLSERLSALGVHPEEVDTILLTHGHPDHLGGLLSACGQPVFRHARLYVHPLEAAYWQDDAMMAQADARRKDNFMLARATLEAYAGQLRYLQENETIAGIVPVWLPGHTPGHTSFRIDGAEKSLLIWGDIVHFPRIQSEQPEVSIAFDCDPDKARETRRHIMLQASRQNWLVGGMHFARPGFASIAPSEEGFRLTYIEE
ncbi:MBL fold metallo-hydrolase [Yokenella regensburgei]|uniref:MBL fold metallo-hydrolase n=1 Tax=Yokenella regensburgei TaxID=158877 RepID=UPI003F18A803